MLNLGKWITAGYALIFGIVATGVLDSPANYGLQWRTIVFFFAIAGVLTAYVIVFCVQTFGSQDVRATQHRLGAVTLCALIFTLLAVTFDLGDNGPLRALAPFYVVTFLVSMLAGVVVEGVKRLLAVDGTVSETASALPDDQGSRDPLAQESTPEATPDLPENLPKNSSEGRSPDPDNKASLNRGRQVVEPAEALSDDNVEASEGRSLPPST